MASNEEIFLLLRDVRTRLDEHSDRVSEEITELRQTLESRVAPLEKSILRHDHHFAIVGKLTAWVAAGTSVAGLWQIFALMATTHK